MNKLASVELRKGEFVVTSYSQTPPGFWKMNGVFRRVRSDADSTKLGQATLEALDASNRTPLRDVDSAEDSFSPVLDALGLKDFGQYMKGAVSVSLEIGPDDALRLTPTRNGGARQGFVELTDLSHVLQDRSAASIGRAVQDAMIQSRK